MTLKRIAAAALGLALLLALAGPVRAGSPAHIHFVVVPATPKAGLSFVQAMAGLRNGFVKLAGGYTEWVLTQGAAQGAEGVQRENNFSFLVAAERNLTDDLAKLVQRYFEAPRPFVLHWLGDAGHPLAPPSKP
ncbi:MAG: hypothetical protein C4525_14790 [Desulfarculus sp.]|jgi:hypothetical protein|nr:MAG: hypothetical protein C4525_14790 [Desulfarculus sp.]